VLFVYPIWAALREAFIVPGRDGGFTLAYVAEVFMNALYREGLINSFQIAIWSTLG
jgi:iron(III) transport system permease protein